MEFANKAYTYFTYTHAHTLLYYNIKSSEASKTKNDIAYNNSLHITSITRRFKWVWLITQSDTIGPLSTILPVHITFRAWGMTIDV